MTNTIRLLSVAAALAVGLAAPSFVCGQHSAPATIADSYARARALLEAAITAHGGPDALAAARQIRVTFTGSDVWRNQSRKVNPPYDREPLTADLHIDLRRGRLLWASTSAFPGGIPRSGAFLTDSARHFRLEYRAQTYAPAQYPPAEQQTGNLFYVPQWILASARQNAGSVRWLGRMQLSTGAAVDVIAATIGGNQTNLAFDPETKQLRATLAVFADVLAGDAASEVEFVGYRPLNGMLLPTRRVSRTAGEVTRELTYVSATLNYSMPDSLAAPPSGFAAAAPPAPSEPVKVVAPGIWAVGGGAAALVVALRDYILVVDAPQGTDAATIERIKALAPGKPIRYVIPTHHHSDHAGGVKQYAAAGTTIVTTPASRAYMERLATARSTLLNDLPSAAARPAIETITGKRRVFSDGTRTVEIHDIGPNPHADEMMVAWIPEEGVLFQGDLIDVPLNGMIYRGANNETTTHFAQWLQKQNWNVRVYAGSHGFLRSPADFAELVRQPILR